MCDYRVLNMRRSDLLQKIHGQIAEMAKNVAMPTHCYSPGGWIPRRAGSPWVVTVGASVPERRVPNPSYVVGGLGWVSPAAGLRMEAKR